MSKNHARMTRSSPTAAGAASSSVQSNPAAAVEIKPNPEAVRRRAYELYLERARTGKPGDEAADWVQAERELLARRER